jgi:drug/metabolite transporter (DMT)-like permease
MPAHKPGGTLKATLALLSPPQRSMSDNHNPAWGILYLCLGVFVFSAQDAIIKQVSGGYPLTEVVFIRSCVAAPILLALVQRESGWRAIFSSSLGLLTLRATIMFGAYTAYYMAFPALPLADAVALYFTVPLFVTALAGPFLGERTHWGVWLAVLLGFAGVMVMLQPGSGLFEPAALLSLLAAALYGMAMLMARKFGDTLSASVMAFYQNGVFMVGAGLAALLLHGLGVVRAEHPSVSFLVRPWVMPSLTDGLLIAACGVVAAAGIMLLTNAYRVARASTVTPFEYTGILWAPLWGFLFFSEVPRATTLAGAAVIVVAGLLALRLAKS